MEAGVDGVSGIAGGVSLEGVSWEEASGVAGCRLNHHVILLLRPAGSLLFALTSFLSLFLGQDNVEVLRCADSLSLTSSMEGVVGEA